VARPEGRPDPEYARRKADLPSELQLRLSLIEEQVVADPNRTYQREFGDDGVVYDHTMYDDFGLTLAYVRTGDEFTWLGFSFKRGKG
jgi:hypothetical protein